MPGFVRFAHYDEHGSLFASHAGNLERYMTCVFGWGSKDHVSTNGVGRRLLRMCLKLLPEAARGDDLDWRLIRNFE